MRGKEGVDVDKTRKKGGTTLISIFDFHILWQPFLCFSSCKNTSGPSCCCFICLLSCLYPFISSICIYTYIILINTYDMNKLTLIILFSFVCYVMSFWYPFACLLAFCSCSSCRSSFTLCFPFYWFYSSYILVRFANLSYMQMGSGQNTYLLFFSSSFIIRTIFSLFFVRNNYDYPSINFFLKKYYTSTCITIYRYKIKNFLRIKSRNR